MNNILLFSTSLSPQIVTESIYYHTQIKKIKIHEVHIITDGTGEKLLDDLFKWYHKFLNEYEIKANSIKFNKDTTYILKDSNNTVIKDLKTLEENNAAVSQVFNIFDKLTSNSNNRIITCVAGGRRTMSVIIGQAMQFYARENDQLTHVIVDDEIAGCPNFYYPSKKSRMPKGYK